MFSDLQHGIGWKFLHRIQRILYVDYERKNIEKVYKGKLLY